MDPVTHALIGMAASTAVQNKFDITSPITAAAALGAVMPDGDIILRLESHAFYLKHHRGESHSIIVAAVESVFAAAVLKAVFMNTPYATLFLWTFLGVLTHLASDLLNSYGAKVFWPLVQRKNSLSLIAITDPFLLLFTVITIYWSYKGLNYKWHILIYSALYLSCKALMRLWGYIKLKNRFSREEEVIKIHLLPAMIAVHKLHYIIDTRNSRIVGELDFVLNRVAIKDRLQKAEDTVRMCVLETDMAAYFKEFTPIFHIDFEKIENGYRAMLTDLRYMFGNRYLHHATIIYDNNLAVIREKFNPYSMNNSIDIL